MRGHVTVTQEMKKLYPYTADGEIDDQSTRMHSHWVALLSDATMLDVSLYFATQVYTARLRHHAEQFLVAAAKSNAFHSLRKRLSDVSDGCPDTLVASILTLTILDVRDPFTFRYRHLCNVADFAVLNSKAWATSRAGRSI